MKLLTLGNTKLMKGEKLGYHSYVLHFAPANLSGFNVCPMASAGCKAACLNTAGRGKFSTTQVARVKKTRWFFENRDSFMVQLVKDIRSAVKHSAKLGFIPVVRLNGTSDIRWEDIGVDGFDNVMSMFPTVQFYDYTKLTNRDDVPANYHLTFSRSETNGKVLPTIEHNIAVVFATKKGADLPLTYIGRKVVDGDETDLRFLDGKNVVVGLRAKGDAKKGDFSNFVVTV